MLNYEEETKHRFIRKQALKNILTTGKLDIRRDSRGPSEIILMNDIDRIDTEHQGTRSVNSYGRSHHETSATAAELIKRS